MSADDAPGLEVFVGGTRRTVTPGSPFVVGRDEDADLQVLDGLVSRRHLLITSGVAGWTIEDTSRNGCFVAGTRVQHMLVTAPTTVRLGSPDTAPELVLQPTRPAVPDAGTAMLRSSEQGRLATVRTIQTRSVRIGRAPDNDMVLDDLLVSRHHAVLARSESGWRLSDLSSANGTFVNGSPITTAEIGPGDVVGVGHSLLEIDGDRLVEHVDVGAVSFRAVDLAVTVAGGRRILDDVGFSLEQRSLLAVVGPSGAGKSTLLRALTGFRPADSGRVEYAGRDLYADYDELRQRIGLVPQDDILHPQLTVRRALRYAARLRFPPDVGREERDRRIDEVLTELGLADQADQRIESLSGGQRKRTSVALELLTRPSLLFLDEPTSGLDPGLDKSVMRTLRSLADEGRTVVVVTHSVANLDVCDRLLLLAPGGSVAFFGPPAEALHYFRVDDFADVFTALERGSGTDWGARFRASPHWSRYVRDPASRAGSDPAPRPPVPAPEAQGPPRRGPAGLQFAVLCRRYLAVLVADRQYTAFMVALPLVLSGLCQVLPGDGGLSLASTAKGSPQSLFLVLVVGGALMGSAASIRELVKERAIYRRERAIGQSRQAYLWSKLVVLGLITGMQGLLLGVLGNIGRPPPDSASTALSPTVEIVVAVVAVTVASMVVGLFVSALIDNADRGMPLLVLLAMLQFILSSAIVQIGGIPVLGQLAWLVPARWGFALGASTIGLDGLPPNIEPDPLWRHAAATWWTDLACLGGLTVLFLVGTGWLLRRIEPRRRRAGAARPATPGPAQ